MESVNPEDLIEAGDLDKGVELDDLSDDTNSSSDIKSNEIDDALDQLEDHSNLQLFAAETNLASEAGELEADMLKVEISFDESNEEDIDLDQHSDEGDTDEVIDNLDSILDEVDTTFNSIDDFEVESDDSDLGEDGFNMDYDVEVEADSLDIDYDVDGSEADVDGDDGLDFDADIY